MKKLIYLSVLLVGLMVQAQDGQWLRYSTLATKGGVNFANLSSEGDGEYSTI